MISIGEIKKNARQSYLDQQTQDNEGGCADAVSYIGGFTAGAKWMQEKNAKEIEQLTTKIEQERSHIRTCHIAMEGHHKEIEQLKQRLEIAQMAIRKCNDDHWFMINLLERYSTDKEQALKDVLDRLKFRKPLYEKTLEKISAEKEQ